MNNCNSKFKEMGHYLIQMGLYLCSKENGKFEEDNQIHTNIINFLMQSYLFLKTYNDKPVLEISNEVEQPKEKDNQYLSRKELLKMYYPLFTDYALTQSIHTKGLPHIKRGSKYFFKKSEIDAWLSENNANCGNKRIRYV